jgi:hypothetical protein
MNDSFLVAGRHGASTFHLANPELPSPIQRASAGLPFVIRRAAFL